MGAGDEQTIARFQLNEQGEVIALGERQKWLIRAVEKDK